MDDKNSDIVKNVKESLEDLKEIGLYGYDENISNYTKWGGKVNHDADCPWKGPVEKKYGVLDAANWFMRDLFGMLEIVPTNCFEIGAGFGRNLRLLKETYPNLNVAGCDITPTQVDFGVEDYLKDVDVKLYLSCGTKTKESDSSHDVVYTVSVLQHVMENKFDDIIDEICRISKGTMLHFENHAEITQRFGKSLNQAYEERGYIVEQPQFGVWSDVENKEIVRPNCLFIVKKKHSENTQQI